MNRIPGSSSFSVYSSCDHICRYFFSTCFYYATSSTLHSTDPHCVCVCVCLFSRRLSPLEREAERERESSPSGLQEDEEDPESFSISYHSNLPSLSLSSVFKAKRISHMMQLSLSIHLSLSPFFCPVECTFSLYNTHTYTVIREYVRLW